MAGASLRLTFTVNRPGVDSRLLSVHPLVRVLGHDPIAGLSRAAIRQTRIILHKAATRILATSTATFLQAVSQSAEE